MEKYSKGKIYCIESRSSDMIYIGSTIKQLHERFSSHLSDMKSWMKGNYNYVSSFSILLYGDAKITLLEGYPCKSKEELIAREQYWIEQHGENIANCNYASGSKRKVTRENRKQWIKEINLKLREQQQKEYELHGAEWGDCSGLVQYIDCPCGSRVADCSMESHSKTKKHTAYLKTTN